MPEIKNYTMNFGPQHPAAHGVLRLVLELKQVGRPMVLALNMYDIAQRQGLRIDLERLQAAIGIPIVTTVATRKRSSMKWPTSGFTR